MTPADTSLNERNADFWDHLCGSGLARSLGITTHEPEDLRRFDAAYLAFYPYLGQYLPARSAAGTRVLEIGLGYGTLGQAVLDRGCDYIGCDIAMAPAQLTKFRIEAAGRAASGAVRGSGVALPFADEIFDIVYSIGCLHHTGGMPESLEEIRRVLRPGGRAVIMVYSKWSGRRISRLPLRLVTSLVRGRAVSQEAERARYDSNTTGSAAPHTDFVSVRTLRRMLAGYSAVSIERRNIGGWSNRSRRLLLATRIDRLLGLDLYVRATK